MRRVCCVIAVGSLLATFLVAAPGVSVRHEDKRVEFSADEFALLPKVEVEAEDHGVKHRYRGVAVRDVLAMVSAPLGEKLRGPAFALAVRVIGADGYAVVFGLAEFDAAFRKETILLVDQQDGAALSEATGPWRIVCPGDGRPARWVRQVVAIEVIATGKSEHP